MARWKQRMSGKPTRNLGCWVLWCQIFMPRKAPTLPPKRATAMRRASVTRHLSCRAFHLSMPYRKNATMFIAARQSKRAYNRYLVIYTYYSSPELSLRRRGASGQIGGRKVWAIVHCLSYFCSGPGIVFTVNKNSYFLTATTSTWPEPERVMDWYEAEMITLEGIESVSWLSVALP